MKTSAKIKLEINKLNHEYKLARIHEMEQAGITADIYEKLNKGMYVLVMDTNNWWCDNGELIKLCSADELRVLNNLSKQGFVTKNSFFR